MQSMGSGSSPHPDDPMSATFHNLEEYGKSKTTVFLIDYLTIFIPNLVGTAEQSRRMLTQIGVW